MDVNAISEPILGIHLAGKVVIVRKKFFGKEFQEGDRRFQAQGGFGCNPSARGTAVYGDFLSDGEHARIERGDIEGIAADQTMPSKSDSPAPHQGEPGLEPSKGDSIGE